MRRALAVLATALLCAPALTACGGEDDAPPSGSTDPKVIDVRISGDAVTPNGDRVEVSTGQEVQLHVTADRAGEIHVHSDPEQQLEYQQGETTLTIPGIATPGTVDVESHTLDKVIVQLEVH